MFAVFIFKLCGSRQVLGHVAQGEGRVVASRRGEGHCGQVRGSGGQLHGDTRTQLAHLLQHSLGLLATGQPGGCRESERKGGVEREREREVQGRTKGSL